MADVATIDYPTYRLDDIEAHRVDLTGYCYRMLGSAFDAEDAVQETLMRAWRAVDSFEGRSTPKTWLYRIATNVCLDALTSKQRRVLPMDLTAASTADASIGDPLPEATWLQPISDARAIPTRGDPGDLAAAKDTIRLAFVAALQHLPPQQRAVLILREVLKWKATEVAELLDTTVSAVKSALQRARRTMARQQPPPVRPADLDGEQARLLATYVDAFERYDIDRLVAVLRDDATLSMPPRALWLRGASEIGRWLRREDDCRGSVVLPVAANGSPAFAQYRRRPAGGHEAFAVCVLEFGEGKVAAIDTFVDADLFTLFDLPLRLDR